MTTQLAPALSASLPVPTSEAPAPLPTAPTTGTARQRFGRARVWAGRFLSGFAVLFLAMDASTKLFGVVDAKEGTEQLGWSAELIFPLGVIQAVCLVAYVVPRTALVGAVLWTGYLGGAIATHVRIDNPLFSHVLFPVYVAMFLWVHAGAAPSRLPDATPRSTRRRSDLRSGVARRSACAARPR